jgi:hypothetical protein
MSQSEVRVNRSIDSKEIKMGQVELGKRRVWRRNTYLWVFGGLLTISALIYWEQTALLFGLSTLAMCALLIIVAIADLEGRDKEQHKQVLESEPAPPKVSVLADSKARNKHKGAA